MKIRSDAIAEVDAFGKRPDASLLTALWSGETAVVRVRGLVSMDACEHLSQRLLASPRIVDHADVDGLRVIGVSHFQAVRNSQLANRYHEEARTSWGLLRALASPFASPFDSAIAFLAQVWPAGCQFMDLPTEGALAPFTVRIYRAGVEIEPHQDILSAESPNDSAATSLTQQFGANIYLSMGMSGGVLELFETDYSETDYKNLAHGPRIIDRSSMPKPVMVTPKVGELLILSSHRIHAVTATRGEIPRMTISFFIGVEGRHLPLKIWA